MTCRNEFDDPAAFEMAGGTGMPSADSTYQCSVCPFSETAPWCILCCLPAVLTPPRRSLELLRNNVGEKGAKWLAEAPHGPYAM